ncbi:hypothetical protein Tsubulata_045629 [Turnera subulata]|uniref:NTF2 domain-containing protein n=1 Tax=Turnera subulata TaxID=218843 RepID=A0A9Q0F3S9_9ROSI|nr:hypothetical protein Tsubulata_045629 [Turnera subulata]
MEVAAPFGGAFVDQYYPILLRSPELVHRIYKDGSKLGRHGVDGIMTTTTTLPAIKEKILSLGYVAGYVAEISSVDSQQSFNGGAVQVQRYYVLNDVLRYVDDGPKHRDGNLDHDSDVDTHPTPVQEMMARGVQAPSTIDFARALVLDYYEILHQELCRFFCVGNSKLRHPVEGLVRTNSGSLRVIKDKILSLGYDNYVAEISSIDAQESLNGSFLVLVSGCFKGSDNWSLRYSQLLFLTPQIRGNYKGYCVLTDVFRFVGGPKYQDGNQGNGKKQDWSDTGCQILLLFPAALAEDGKMHRNGDIGEKKEEELALAADKIPDVEEVAANTRTASESGTKIEGLPKKSYASLERRKRNWRSLPIKFLMLWRASPIMVNGCPVIVEEKRSGYQGKGTMGDGFHLEQGMGTEMREQEGQQTLEAEVMVGVILLAEQIVETGEGNLGQWFINMSGAVL